MSDDTGGQDGLRMVDGQALRRARFVDRQQPAMRARPCPVPIRAPAHRLGGGFEYARVAPAYAFLRCRSERPHACSPAELGLIDPHAM